MKNIIWILFVMIAFVACEDIIEEDISKDTFSINSPVDNYSSTNSSITFFWEFLEHADYYQLQVVNGRFDSVISFVLDSNIAADRFVYSFNPGNYQWRIRAVNSVSETAFHTRSFQIDSTNDLSQVKVNLLNPENNLLSGINDITFRWNQVFSATAYVLEIRTGNWNSGVEIFKDTIIGVDTMLNGFDSDHFSWTVKAFNNESESVVELSDAFTFEVDTVVPLQATLKSPITTSPLSPNPVVLTWVNGIDNNPGFDSLFIYEDQSRTILKTDEKVTLPANGDVTYTDTTLSSGITYWWEVKSIDAVGNIGPSSDLKSFIPQ